MKPKTITQIVTHALLKHANDFAEFVQAKRDEPSLNKEVAECVSQIQQLLEECAPEKKTVKDDLASMTLQERYIDLKHEGFNQAIDQYKSNIRWKLK